MTISSFIRQFLLPQRLTRGTLGIVLFCAILLIASVLWRSNRLRNLVVDRVDYVNLQRWTPVDNRLQLVSNIRLLGKPDLNTATALDLQNLPGIGKVLSRRIILYRETLGGFYHFDQLQNIQRLPQRLIDVLQTRYRLTSPYRRLSLQHSSFTRLAAHPHIGVVLGRRLVSLRDTLLIQSMAQLQQRLHLSDSASQAIDPYIDFTLIP